MSEAASDALSALRDHAPSLPSVADAKSAAKDAASAVLKNVDVPSLKNIDVPSLKNIDVPSLKDIDLPTVQIDPSAIKDKLPDLPTGKKRSFAAVLIGVLALGGAAFAVLRRRNAAPRPVSPSIYTPPLPKP
jgi:LPXTG-motif cell wall-anchored protein